jgi:TonB-linked SusC/RagA family outer membrane protein
MYCTFTGKVPGTPGSSTKIFRVMRMTAFILWIACMQVHANGYSQNITLSVKNAPLRQVFAEIVTRTGISIIYDESLLAHTSPVTISVQDASVRQVMDLCVRNQPITYVIAGADIVIKRLQASPPPAVPQADTSGIVNGVVTGDKGEALPGVTITVKGRKGVGAVTDESGRFRLLIREGDILVFSSLGFTPREMPAKAGATLKVVMQAGTAGMEEIVVVGYGSQKKQDLTGSVVSVNTEKLQQVPASNVFDKLQGRVAGFMITTGNARPGEDQSIRIRGENSLSASNTPLIILDGVPFSGSMNDINPNIIENISVLKDASSTAIYGSRAANGVVLITTKKGRKGAAVVNYSGYYGIQQVERRLKLMNGKEFMQFLTDYNMLKGKQGDELKPENLLHLNEIPQYQQGIETNWQNEVFQAAPMQEHQISVSGGTERSSYFAAIAYFNQDGIVENTGFKRYTATLNIEQDLNSWLKIGVNTQLAQREADGIQPSITNAIALNPYAKNKDATGKPERYPMYPETLYPHPFADADGIYDNKTRSAFAAAFADIQLPLKGLSVRSSFGTNYRNTDRGSYYGRSTLTGAPLNGYAKVENYSNQDWTWENLLKYNALFGDHKIEATGLFSMQETVAKSAVQEGESFVNDASAYHNMSLAGKNQRNKTDLINTALISYMGRINYAYKERYLLTVTGRSDGYSAFGPNNKWAFFPSAALAWVLSSEEFFKGVHNIDLLKLRVSYGKNGNQASSPYQTFDRLTQLDYIWGDGGAPANGAVLRFSGVGNPNLRWESTSSFNIGVDFSLLKGRLSGTLDLYDSRTTDLLMTRQVPVMNGYASIWDNVGETQNRGLELTLNSVNIERKDFTWRTTATFSLDRDRIVELRGNGKDDLTNAWFIGKPLRVFYDYRMTGVWQETDDIAHSHQPNARPGDAKLNDTNGDGLLDANDREVIGSKMPRYLGGLLNEFSYRNFTLSIFLNGVFDITKEDGFKNIERWLPEKNANYLSDMSYWRPGRPVNDVPSPAYVPVNNHKYYMDATFVKIRDVSLAYNFPEKATAWLRLSALRTYLSCRNLYTFSSARGYNLEATTLLNAYPNARTFTWGVNVTF